jgi:hypothetical protein
MELESKRRIEKEKERGCRMKEKVVRDGMIDITTGKRLGKKTVVKLREEVKPKTLWQKIMDWLNAPIRRN